MFPKLQRFYHKWVKPDGYDTGIKIYNCITKDKQPLIVKNKNFVTWYTCGPTVYDLSHIGHACCFLKLDIIQRLLQNYFDINLITVMNITDVDDKIIARSNASKVPPNQLTKEFEASFWKDMDSFNIIRPDCVLRVTDNMDCIKKFIEILLQKRKAYQAENGTIYFDLSHYQYYGKLQNIGEVTETVKFKKSSMDFALWKPVKPGEIYWESSWGDGRPGWHIECSALATKIFGSEIDFHAGGIDLRFPHHENEEAQSCSFHDKPQWVNYWVHAGHLHLRNCEKMSKSLKNTISVATLLENTTPQVFRMACLMSHYRRNMEFSPEFVQTATTTLDNYKNFIDNCQNYLSGLVQADINREVLEKLLEESTSKIHEAFVDDFNTPKVVQTLNEIVTKVNGILHSSRTDSSDSKSVLLIAVLNLVVRTLEVLGIDIKMKECRSDNRDFVEVMNILNDFRQSVRQLGIAKKDTDLLQACDAVRSSLKNCGVTIKDHGKISSWS